MKKNNIKMELTQEVFLDKTLGNYTIRLLEVADASLFFELIENNRNRLEDFISGITSKTKNLSETQQFLQDCNKRIIDRIYFPYMLWNIENKELVGFLDVKNIDWNIPKAEIGYFIDTKYTGKGLASAFLQVVTQHYLDILGFQKIVLRIHKENISSIKVATNCGFEKEGIVKKDYKKTNGEIVDMIYFGKTK